MTEQLRAVIEVVGRAVRNHPRQHLFPMFVQADFGVEDISEGRLSEPAKLLEMARDVLSGAVGPAAPVNSRHSTVGRNLAHP